MPNPSDTLANVVATTDELQATVEQLAWEMMCCQLAIFALAVVILTYRFMRHG